MPSARNRQRDRDRRERDPELARRYMYAELLAAQDEWPCLQDHDPHELVDTWLAEWTAQLAGGQGRGPDGLRGFCSRKTSALIATSKESS